MFQDIAAINEIMGSNPSIASSGKGWGQKLFGFPS
jgi:hypothetical protein